MIDDLHGEEKKKKNINLCHASAYTNIITHTKPNSGIRVVTYTIQIPNSPEGSLLAIVMCDLDRMELMCDVL